MSRETKQTALHLSPETAELVAKHADLNNRSRHSEMLHRLEASFREPVVELDPNAREVVEARIRKVFTTCFASLEERVLGHLGRIVKEQELVTELKMSGTPAEREALLAAMRNAHPLYFFPEEPGHTGPVRDFDLAKASTKSSAQDTLSDVEPLSGMSTLAASIRRMGCMCEGGVVGGIPSTANFGGYFSGGFCGLPPDELPKILEKGEPVIDLSQYKQFSGRVARWVVNTGSRPPPETLGLHDEIEVRLRPHGHSQRGVAGEFCSADWESSPTGRLPRIISWRPAQHLDTSIRVEVINDRMVPCTPEEEAALGAVRTSEGLTIGGVAFGPGTKISRTLAPTRVERPQPFTGQNWVITGSLESMTRDRAREIIMDLGGGVAGSVDRNTHAVVWGPGAGSKKSRAEQLGVQQYSERQFIDLIRSHGVDMPQVQDPWNRSPGVMPDTDGRLVDVQFADGGHFFRKPAHELSWAPNKKRQFDIAFWRFSR